MTKHAHENGDGSATRGESGRVRVVHMHEQEPTEVDWLWDGLIARGKLSTLVGHPGVGKSTLTCEIAARVTRGDSLPLSRRPNEPESVLLIGSEDADGDTIRPRLDKAGADVTMVKRLAGLNGKEGELVPWDFSRKTHRKRLKEMLERFEPALLVVDPLSPYLGGINSHKEAAVRRVLEPLAHVAAETHTAFLLIRHLNKSEQQQVILRAAGSIGITGTVRSEIMVGANPKNQAEKAIIQMMNNVSDLKPAIGFEINGGAIHFSGRSDLILEDIAQGGSGRAPKREAAIDFLEERLAGEEGVPVKELIAEAQSKGISESTLRRAAEALAVEKVKVGFQGGHWEWSLPEDHHI